MSPQDAVPLLAFCLGALVGLTVAAVVHGPYAAWYRRKFDEPAVLRERAEQAERIEVLEAANDAQAEAAARMVELEEAETEGYRQRLRRALRWVAWLRRRKTEIYRLWRLAEDDLVQARAALEFVANNPLGCRCDPPGSGEEYCTDHCTARAALAAELAGARKVLGWYADDRNYGRPDGPNSWADPPDRYYVVGDHGERARAALSRLAGDCAPAEEETDDV